MTDREACDLLDEWLARRSLAHAAAAAREAMDGLLDRPAGGDIFNRAGDLALALHREAEAVRARIVAAMTGKKRG